MQPTRRKSFMELGEIFFYTATINGWKHLMADDRYKQVLVDSFQNLSERSLADVFGFVVMPNHVHLIWRARQLNGKESVQGSFLKYTAHCFKKMLLQDDRSELLKYAVAANNKQFEFWQRDPLAIHLYSPEVAFQKLSYMHLNPLAEHWQMANDPADYYYSSASFYEKGTTEFSFLRDLREEF